MRRKAILFSIAAILLILLGYFFWSRKTEEKLWLLTGLSVLFYAVLTVVAILLARWVKALRRDISELLGSIRDVKHKQADILSKSFQSTGGSQTVTPPVDNKTEDESKGTGAKPTETKTEVEEQNFSPPPERRVDEVEERERANEFYFPSQPERKIDEVHRRQEANEFYSSPQPERKFDRDYSYAFPCSVAEYQRYLEETKATVILTGSKRFFKGFFVENHEGQFFMVKGERNPQGPFLIVPRVTRFSAQDIFHIHYEDCFDCRNPSVGEIWVIKPALVVAQEARGEWKLEEKGVLEVR